MGSIYSLCGSARTTTALLAYDAGGDHRPPVAVFDRRQSFDDYLDLSKWPTPDWLFRIPHLLS